MRQILQIPYADTFHLRCHQLYIKALELLYLPFLSGHFLFFLIQFYTEDPTDQQERNDDTNHTQRIGHGISAG